MKTTIKLISGILLLTALSCTKESIKSKSAPANSIDMSTQITYHIGDAHGGGIIVYLDSTKKHGIVAAKTDQSSKILLMYKKLNILKNRKTSIRCLSVFYEL